VDIVLVWEKPGTAGSKAGETRSFACDEEGEEI
jgi:hypothetical protein